MAERDVVAGIESSRGELKDKFLAQVIKSRRANLGVPLGLDVDALFPRPIPNTIQMEYAKWGDNYDTRKEALALFYLASHQPDTRENRPSGELWEQIKFAVGDGCDISQ